MVAESKQWQCQVDAGSVQPRGDTSPKNRLSQSPNTRLLAGIMPRQADSRLDRTQACFATPVHRICTHYRALNIIPITVNNPEFAGFG